MKALLVIDVDHGDGWSPDALRKNPKREQVSIALQELLEAERRKNGLIVFIVFSFPIYYKAPDVLRRLRMITRNTASRAMVAGVTKDV